MKPEVFAVEQWMDAYETSAKYNIAETCCDSISISELVALSDGLLDVTSVLDANTRQTYGHIRGTPELRENIARLYASRHTSELSPEQVLITPGAIAANHLVLYTLVGAGDHVICHHPTYQQLYSIPASLGAEVDLWHATPESNWIPDIDRLQSLVKTNTKLIIVNNPNNPSGAVLDRSFLEKVVDVARAHDIIVLADEVYRPIFHGIQATDPPPPSILSLNYRNTVATGSLSKAYSLAGIRVGWIASRSSELIELFAETRDYTTISVSQLDQAVAATALRPGLIEKLLERNVQLASRNLKLLTTFVESHKDVCSWVKPVAGTTAMLKFSHEDSPIDAVSFCSKLLEKTGVFLLPADRGFGAQFVGFVRIGYVSDTATLKHALALLHDFLASDMYKGL